MLNTGALNSESEILMMFSSMNHISTKQYSFHSIQLKYHVSMFLKIHLIYSQNPLSCFGI